MGIAGCDRKRRCSGINIDVGVIVRTDHGVDRVGIEKEIFVQVER